MLYKDRRKLAPKNKTRQAATIVAPEGVLKKIDATRPIEIAKIAIPIAKIAMCSGLRANRPAVAAGMINNAGTRRAPTAFKAMATVSARISIKAARTKPTDTPAVCANSSSRVTRSKSRHFHRKKAPTRTTHP